MQSEKQFQKTVLDMAAVTGWLSVFQDAPARKCPKCHTYVPAYRKAGHPDLELVRGTHLAYLELKRNQGGRTTAEQKEVVGRLSAVTEVTAGIYKPSDWDEIERILR